MAILRLLGCGFRRPAEALTSHYLLQEGVELSFESVLRHAPGLRACSGSCRGEADPQLYADRKHQSIGWRSGRA